MISGVSIATLFNVLRMARENTKEQINARRRLVDEIEKAKAYNQHQEEIARNEVLTRMRAQSLARMGVDPWAASNPSILPVFIAEQSRKANYGS